MKEEIEQLKRDLKSHIHYLKELEEIQTDLERIAIQLQECGDVKGISFEEKTGTGNAYRSPSALGLISEEEDFMNRREMLHKQIEFLDIEEKMKCLSDLEATIIRSLYFNKYSFRYTATQLNYSHTTLQYYNDKALEKMLEVRTRTIVN